MTSPSSDNPTRARILMGIETEYALAGGDLEPLAARLIERVGASVPYLRGGRDWDLFLANGSRFYLDCGAHPEMSTPECSSPSETVRYIRAGDRLLDEVIRAMVSDGALPHPMLFRCNVDYTGKKTTWGSHESYLHRHEPSVFPDELVAHLVSRIIFTGAGGCNPFSAGIVFTLSPRSWHLRHVVSAESTSNRGIFHTKDETLAAPGWHRLHLICGESLCSDIAAYLRVGTTALVVRMIDAGLQPGSAVALKSPLVALRKFALDATCRKKVRLANGRALTAIEIERHYLEMAERHLGEPLMPEWADEVCREWRLMLERLERGADGVSNTLDWALKHQICRRRVEQKGLRWSTLPAWNHVAESIRAGLRASEHQGTARVELILGQKDTPSPIPDVIKNLTPYLEQRGLDWDMLRPFIDLRRELFEIDMRFSQLGASGIFDAIDKAGILNHRAPGVDDIARARLTPPTIGRARLRGEAVRAFAGSGRRYRCMWTGIIDAERKQRMNLSDPFEEVVEWRKPQKKPKPSSERSALLRSLLLRGDASEVDQI